METIKFNRIGSTKEFIRKLFFDQMTAQSVLSRNWFTLRKWFTFLPNLFRRFIMKAHVEPNIIIMFDIFA